MPTAEACHWRGLCRARTQRLEKERIGIDTADMSAMNAFQERGLNLVNARPAISQARRVKTPDEIELLKMSASLQQFAHSIGLSLYEGMWVSRAYSLEYPVELQENMYFACETFAGHPGLEQKIGRASCRERV